ncbi:cytochrome c oxidase subunit 3 [Sphingomonas sp. AR_OL41]|uniref:cytochrome c oxidase subunit 3 n=1 Tax=Sphingomonas sp. AR_OL41 TaxID=3042729 RepID=UPI00247FEF74|nr:cytochrome c oxidase subunit 3 [Sphingomonas sp. AR_OL41]MDH7974202.1 cytochrome c oxidase subunit 3 [Sphingomonas sp. AR_OL41]
MAEARTLDEHLPVHGMGRVGTPWWGMLCLIATEGILFAYLIFSYAYLGSQGYQSWPPTGGLPGLGLALPATLLLVGSSFVLEWAKNRARAGHLAVARRALGLAILMGIGFVALSLAEWHGKPFALSADSYSSIYFVLTGTHLAHVAIGLIALIVLLVWSLTGRVGPGHEQHRTLATLYWHFVDAVWLFVFATVYLSPRLA